MPQYRLYCLDGAGSITRAEWIEADGDDEAVRIARDMHKPVKCELWQSARFVAEIPRSAAPDGGTASFGAAPGPAPIRQ